MLQSKKTHVIVVRRVVGRSDKDRRTTGAINPKNNTRFSRGRKDELCRPR